MKFKTWMAVAIVALAVLLMGQSTFPGDPGGLTGVWLELVIDGNPVEGESTVAGRENLIQVSSFSQGVSIPVDPTTGQPTGVRKWMPIRFRKAVDKSTPFLMQAVTHGDPVTDAIFRFYRVDVTGGEEHFYTVRLQNGRVTKLRGVASPATSNDPAATGEEVEIMFQTITWTYEDGNLQATDTLAPRT